MDYASIKNKMANIKVTQMKTISKDGTQIAYDKTGKGPALVLVDGAFCFRQHGVTPDLVPLLSSDFTVFSYDRRGRGESTDTKPYRVEREIEDLQAIVDATNETAFIFGMSSGAALLVQAVSKGLNARKIVLFEPPYVVVNENDEAPPADARERLEDFIKQDKRGGAVKYFMAKVMGVPAIFVLLFRIFGRNMFRKNEAVAHTLTYDVAIMDNFSVPQQLLSKIILPTIVIGGEKSPKKLLNAVQAVGQRMPNSKISLLKGQSHNVSMKVLAPVLIDFFKSDEI
jgi:pimeloyl-ACP methyl ester carboxylesterase